jgi:hypothetical protein
LSSPSISHSTPMLVEVAYVLKLPVVVVVEA